MHPPHDDSPTTLRDLVTRIDLAAARTASPSAAMLYALDAMQQQITALHDDAPGATPSLDDVRQAEVALENAAAAATAAQTADDCLPHQMLRLRR